MTPHYRLIILSGLCAIAAGAADSHAVAAEVDRLAEIGHRLEATPAYSDTASYEVLLPNLSEPVGYSLTLESTAAAGDTLAPCRYFVDWQLPTPGGLSTGFLAYFDGTHYRQRDSRLQEYHYAATPEVFAPGGDTSRGVQSQAQFADLLPQAIGRHFADMAADSSYIYKVTADTLVGGRRSVVVEGVRRLSGFDCAEYVYILDGATLLPRRIELENNPGQLGEQLVTVVYGDGGASASVPVIDEAYVVGRKPEEFGKYREDTFSIASLAGKAMPRIAAKTVGGDRYCHERGEGFEAPTIFVFVDAAVGSTPAIIDAVRSAADAIPARTDIVWAFINHRGEEIENVITPRPGERLLVDARGAARQCGVGSVTPVIVFAAADGTVNDFIVGDNRDMASLVIEKTSMTKLK